MAATGTPALTTFIVYGRNLDTHRSVKNRVQASDMLAAAHAARELRGPRWIFDGAREA